MRCSFWSGLFSPLLCALFLVACGAATASRGDRPTRWDLRITEVVRDGNGGQSDELVANIRRSGDHFEWSPSSGESDWRPLEGSAADVEARLGAVEDAVHLRGEAYDGELPITFIYRDGGSEVHVSILPSNLTEDLATLRRAAVTLVSAQSSMGTDVASGGGDREVDPGMGGFSEGQCSPEVHVSRWVDEGESYDLCSESCVHEGVRFDCITREERDELDRSIVNDESAARERLVASLIDRIRGRLSSGEVVIQHDPSDVR